MFHLLLKNHAIFTFFSAAILCAPSISGCELNQSGCGLDQEKVDGECIYTCPALDGRVDEDGDHIADGCVEELATAELGKIGGICTPVPSGSAGGFSLSFASEEVAEPKAAVGNSFLCVPPMPNTFAGSQEDVLTGSNSIIPKIGQMSRARFNEFSDILTDVNDDTLTIFGSFGLCNATAGGTTITKKESEVGIGPEVLFGNTIMYARLYTHVDPTDGDPNCYDLFGSVKFYGYFGDRF